MAHHFEKVLREASSSWALLVALSYQKWELGKLVSAGARQGRKLHPVGAQCKRPCTLQDSGKQEEEIPSFFTVLPASSTGITSYQMSQVKYFHSPLPSSQSRQRRI